MKKRTERERNFAFLPLLLRRPSQAQTRRSADTERKHRRTSIQQPLTHTRAAAWSPLIVVFAATRAEEAGNAKRNAFKRNFSCFSFVLSSELFSRDFYLRWESKSRPKREKKIEKKFNTISQSSSCWIIEIESNLQVEKKITRKKEFSFEIFG